MADNKFDDLAGSGRWEMRFEEREEVVGIDFGYHLKLDAMAVGVWEGEEAVNSEACPSAQGLFSDYGEL